MVLEWLGSLIPLKFLDTHHDRPACCGHTIVICISHSTCQNIIFQNQNSRIAPNLFSNCVVWILWMIKFHQIGNAYQIRTEETFLPDQYRYLINIQKIFFLITSVINISSFKETLCSQGCSTVTEVQFVSLVNASVQINIIAGNKYLLKTLCVLNSLINPGRPLILTMYQNGINDTNKFKKS